MDAITELQNALGAELLRADLLGGARPKIGGRYIVEGFLGRGATGLVVAALDDRLGRPVALKLGIASADTTMLAEARALALLDHPNVVRVHDVDVVSAVFDGKPYRLWLVSMQRVEGRNLRLWLREEVRTQQEIVRVFTDAGHGLAAAHAAKIVHRDFKPDNVIVRNDGVAQVLDFGFAVRAASTHSDVREVQGDAAGTEPYMAPEARVGRASRKSDQFSFGVSMVEAFTGEPGSAGEGAPEGVAPELWSVLRRATSRDASDRFPDMPALIGALSGETRDPGWGSIGRLLLLAAVVAVFMVTRGHNSVRTWAERLWTGGHAVAGPPSFCASLPDVMCFRSTVTGTGKWGVYRVQRNGGDACAPSVTVERLYDSARSQYRPGFSFRGATVARVTPMGRAHRLDIDDLYIVNSDLSQPSRLRYWFRLQVTGNNVSGSGWTTLLGGPREPRRDERVDPVSLSDCPAGHDGRRTQ